MRVWGGLKDIGKVSATLTITMTLDEWKQLDEQMRSAHPASQLSQAISKLWGKARREYDEEITQ